MKDTSFTIFYDSVCPICAREIAHLKKRNQAGLIQFVDLKDRDAFEKAYPQVSYFAAMQEIHGITADGEIKKGIPAFIELYDRAGLSWLAWLLQAPLLGHLFPPLYRLWARWRLHNRCKIAPLSTEENP